MTATSKNSRFCSVPSEVTHEQQQTLVLPDGSTAAQEAQQEQQAAQGQHHVHARERQRVGCHDLPEAHGVQQHPDTHTQQEGSGQLEEEETFREQLEDFGLQPREHV